MKRSPQNGLGLTMLLVTAGLWSSSAAHGQDAVVWEAANPLVSVPDPPLGVGGEKNPPATLSELEDPPTPERSSPGPLAVL